MELSNLLFKVRPEKLDIVSDIVPASKGYKIFNYVTNLSQRTGLSILEIEVFGYLFDHFGLSDFVDRDINERITLDRFNTKGEIDHALLESR